MWRREGIPAGAGDASQDLGGDWNPRAKGLDKKERISGMSEGRKGRGN